MPKARYDIMRSYLPTRGHLAMDMMHLTCTVQANFDFSDEADMVAKLRTATAISPIVSALFANSAIHLGKPSGFVSRRLEIWKHTDPDRCGLLPFVFEDGFGYERYVEWALDVPMFFLVREGRYVPAHTPFVPRSAGGQGGGPAGDARRLGDAPDHALPGRAPEAVHRGARGRRGAPRPDLRAPGPLEGDPLRRRGSRCGVGARLGLEPRRASGGTRRRGAPRPRRRAGERSGPRAGVASSSPSPPRD